jgi:hypothetical protein
MANINNNKKSLNRVQLMKENNSNLEFLYIDEIKVGAMGSVSEADREAGLAVIQRIVNNSDKKGMALVMEVMSQVNFEASMNENNIQPDEQVRIEDEDCVISYQSKKIYDMAGKELADASDMGDNIPKEAIREILKLRALAKIHELNAEAETDLDYEDDYEDEGK